MTRELETLKAWLKDNMVAVSYGEYEGIKDIDYSQTVYLTYLLDNLRRRMIRDNWEVVEEEENDNNN